MCECPYTKYSIKFHVSFQGIAEYLHHIEKVFNSLFQSIDKTRCTVTTTSMYYSSTLFSSHAHSDSTWNGGRTSHGSPVESFCLVELLFVP